MEAAKAYAEREALANRVKTETMQALSHELRTPLQVTQQLFTHYKL
jgi:signal transduction histidine kinase